MQKMQELKLKRVEKHKLTVGIIWTVL